VEGDTALPLDEQALSANTTSSTADGTAIDRRGMGVIMGA